MNLRFRTAKPLKKNTFVLLTNQQQIGAVSKTLLPLKTGPYIIIDKPTETTYILRDENEEHITIHRNQVVPYYPKERQLKLELQKNLLSEEIPTLKQPNTSDKQKPEIQPAENTNNKTDNKLSYNLRKRKMKLI